MILSKLTFKDFKGISIESYIRTHYVELILQALDAEDHEKVLSLKGDLLRFGKSSDFYSEIPDFLDVVLNSQRRRVPEYWGNYLQKIDAIHLENYERAAEKRDRIREIELLLDLEFPLPAGESRRNNDFIQCTDKEEFLRLVWAPVLPADRVLFRIRENGFSWLFSMDEQWVHKRCEGLPETEPKVIKELIQHKEMRIRREKFSPKHMDALIDGLNDAEGDLKDALLDLAIAQYMLMLEEEEKIGRRKVKSATDDGSSII